MDSFIQLFSYRWMKWSNYHAKWLWSSQIIVIRQLFNYRVWLGKFGRNCFNLKCIWIMCVINSYYLMFWLTVQETNKHMLIHINCLWGIASADMRAAQKLCLVLAVWHFPVFDRWACHQLLHSGQVLLSLSVRTPQDGEVSTSISKIISTTHLIFWRYCVALCSGGMTGRTNAK